MPETEQGRAALAQQRAISINSSAPYSARNSVSYQLPQLLTLM